MSPTRCDCLYPTPYKHPDMDQPCSLHAMAHNDIRLARTLSTSRGANLDTHFDFHDWSCYQQGEGDIGD